VKRTDLDFCWYKWFTGQGHEMVDFGGQGVKGQGHARLEIDLEA